MPAPMPKAAMPHCDSRVLHAPGECEYCDGYPAWQEARRMWGVAFTGHRPEDGELPCPSEVTRDIDTINEWPGNRPAPSPTIAAQLGRPRIPPPDAGLSQLGRPNIPVLRKDLERMIREIVLEMMQREELYRGEGGGGNPGSNPGGGQ